MPAQLPQFFEWVGIPYLQGRLDGLLLRKDLNARSHDFRQQPIGAVLDPYLLTHAIGSLHGRSVEEVSLAGKPKPSLQGRIHGVFRNRLPMRGA
jgi:hypothetical protein